MELVHEQTLCIFRQLMALMFAQMIQALSRMLKGQKFLSEACQAISPGDVRMVLLHRQI